ncbi:endonuclease III [Oxobacter pfennigii]|uniref:Endonuclease III n=1 Tax=Oxobacter pfennigii TaxID=36849 RepID=A0A0P8YDF5_9CLOT|nr:endonuclease III [Oxobacter pfennigii]KPU45282.1 endonuclease III [Oxobacter pfennigii]
MKEKFKKFTDEDVKGILDALVVTFPEAHCELNHRNPFQLLVATILSAQATDKTVNKVTDKLFLKYQIPEDFLSIPQEVLEQEIKEIGLYRSKSKNIQAMCRELLERFNGKVPSTMEELVSLPGVGRKTANVVLSNAFGIPAIAVDTHVFRVSNRIGLATADNVEKTEDMLMENIPKDRWSHAHHLLIWHGRRICAARNPKCPVCPISGYCRYYSGLEEK